MPFAQMGHSGYPDPAPEHLPIDFDLYPPEEWANDPVRRREAHIPESVQLKTKVDLALDEIERAVADKAPGES